MTSNLCIAKSQSKPVIWGGLFELVKLRRANWLQELSILAEVSHLTTDDFLD